MHVYRLKPPIRLTLRHQVRQRDIGPYFKLSSDILCRVEVIAVFLKIYTFNSNYLYSTWQEKCSVWNNLVGLPKKNNPNNN